MTYVGYIGPERVEAKNDPACPLCADHLDVAALRARLRERFAAEMAVPPTVPPTVPLFVVSPAIAAWAREQGIALPPGTEVLDRLPTYPKP